MLTTFSSHSLVAFLQHYYSLTRENIELSLAEFRLSWLILFTGPLAKKYLFYQAYKLDVHHYLTK